MNKHTPLPWNWGRCTGKYNHLLGPACFINGPEGKDDYDLPARICDTHGDNREANAEFIVRACNCHEELLLAIIRLTEKVERANSIQHSGGRIHAEDWAELYQLANESRAAIAHSEARHAD